MLSVPELEAHGSSYGLGEIKVRFDFFFFFGDRLGVLWVSGDQEWERLRLK